MVTVPAEEQAVNNKRPSRIFGVCFIMMFSNIIAFREKQNFPVWWEVL
jgi:hypothetical protein